METNNKKNEMLINWLNITSFQATIANELEGALQDHYNLSLNEFYVLYFLSQADEKKLRLQQLQEMVGLSQSAMSRLVSRLEAKNCGSLKRHICEKDRRGVYTSITDKGEDKLQKCLNTFSETFQTTLSKDELEKELRSFIHKLSSLTQIKHD